MFLDPGRLLGPWAWLQLREAHHFAALGFSATEAGEPRFLGGWYGMAQFMDLLINGTILMITLW